MSILILFLYVFIGRSHLGECDFCSKYDLKASVLSINWDTYIVDMVEGSYQPYY